MLRVDSIHGATAVRGVYSSWTVFVCDVCYQRKHMGATGPSSYICVRYSETVSKEKRNWSAQSGETVKRVTI